LKIRHYAAKKSVRRVVSAETLLLFSFLHGFSLLFRAVQKLFEAEITSRQIPERKPAVPLRQQK